MLVGACLDAGVELAAIAQELTKLELPGYELTAEKVRRSSIAGTLFRVCLEPAVPHAAVSDSHAGHGEPQRNLPDVREILQRARFDPGLERRMVGAFDLLARAEAEAHGIGIDEVHFHEVGAVDAIIDVCAAVIAFDRLAVERIFCSEVVVGTGTVACAHGTLPVPAPGTLALLSGVPIRAGSGVGERCTPTGAALLRVLVDEFAQPVSFRPITTGYGAGVRDDGPVPNMVRVTIGEVEDERGIDLVWELALQVDNVSGEVLGHALRRVFDQGALDAWAAPTLTKKGRPAHWVVALADDARRSAIEDCLLAELPSLGLRRHRVERRTLPRRVEARSTPLGEVRFKIRTLPDGTELLHPESDDVERLAREHDLPVPAVIARILPRQSREQR